MASALHTLSISPPTAHLRRAGRCEARHPGATSRQHGAWWEADGHSASVGLLHQARHARLTRDRPGVPRGVWGPDGSFTPLLALAYSSAEQYFIHFTATENPPGTRRWSRPRDRKVHKGGTCPFLGVPAALAARVGLFQRGSHSHTRPLSACRVAGSTGKLVFILFYFYSNSHLWLAASLF